MNGQEVKGKYITNAFQHLEDIAVLSVRKKPLDRLGFIPGTKRLLSSGVSS